MIREQEVKSSNTLIVLNTSSDVTLLITTMKENKNEGNICSLHRSLIILSVYNMLLL